MFTKKWAIEVTMDMIHRTRRIGQATESRGKDRLNVQWEQAPIIAAQRKTWTRLLEATLMANI